MFCKNCGKEIPEGGQFCMACGQKVEEGQDKNVSMDTVQNKTAGSADAQGNRKLIMVIIGIAAAFLVVAIVFGVLILGKLGDGGSDKNGNDEVVAEQNDNKEETDTAQTEKSDADGSSKDESAGEIEADDTAKTDETSENIEDTVEVDAPKEDIAAMDDAKAVIAQRFPKLVEGYKEPKSDKTMWIPIDDATRAKLEALDNDYNKVAWVVEYAFRALPDMVVSFTINENCGVPYTIVGFTNVGDKALSIDGTADIYDFDNNRLTSGYPYTGMLQPGGTYICPISCSGADENNIDLGFTELNMDLAAAKPGSYSSTATLGDSTNTNIITSISVENTYEKKELMGQVTVLLLDEEGFPVANGYVFGATSTNPGEKMESDVQIGILDTDIDRVKDIAIFASPYVTE